MNGSRDARPATGVFSPQRTKTKKRVRWKWALREARDSASRQLHFQGTRAAGSIETSVTEHPQRCRGLRAKVRTQRLPSDRRRLESCRECADFMGDGRARRLRVRWITTA